MRIVVAECMHACSNAVGSSVRLRAYCSGTHALHWSPRCPRNRNFQTTLLPVCLLRVPRCCRRLQSRVAALFTGEVIHGPVPASTRRHSQPQTRRIQLEAAAVLPVRRRIDPRPKLLPRGVLFAIPSLLLIRSDSTVLARSRARGAPKTPCLKRGTEREAGDPCLPSCASTRVAPAGSSPI